MPRAASRRRGLPVTGVSAATDRRFRRADLRPRAKRSRRAIVVAIALAAGAAAATAGLAVWIGMSIVYAEAFRVDRVVVRGQTRLAAADVRALLADVEGQSLFLVDLADCRRRVLTSPWVADASVSRRLPSTIEVRVVERVPLAIARLHGRLYLVDREGVIVDEAGPAFEDYDLPIVDGLLAERPGGDLADPARLQTVERFLTELAGRPDLLGRVSQIDVTNPRDVVVLLAGEGVRLRLGDRAFVTRLETYRDTAEAVRGHVTDIDYVDLRFDRPFVGPASSRPVRPRPETSR